MLSFGNIAGCRNLSSEILPSLDTTNCDPALSAQCWSVSTEFVHQRLKIEEENVRLKDALKRCRERVGTG